MSTCPTGKLRHESEDAARKFRGKKSSRGLRMRAYACDQCRGWHLTKEAGTQGDRFGNGPKEGGGRGWTRSSTAGVAASVRRFAQLILHGDEAHRAWLLAAAEQFIKDGTVPKAPGPAPEAAPVAWECTDCSYTYIDVADQDHAGEECSGWSQGPCSGVLRKVDATVTVSDA